MSGSIFMDNFIKPDNKMISEMLGGKISLWKDFRHYLNDQYGELIEDWKFYNQKSWWILKLLKKKRNLFFFIPMKDYFRITFVFGDKAVSAIENSDLPGKIKETLINSRKYMEGRGIQIQPASRWQRGTHQDYAGRAPDGGALCTRHGAERRRRGYPACQSRSGGDGGQFIAGSRGHRERHWQGYRRDHH